VGRRHTWVAEGSERGERGEGDGVCVLSWWGWRESTRSLPPRRSPTNGASHAAQTRTPHMCTCGLEGQGGGVGKYGVV
jgi:hypothetical protein